MVLRVQPGNLLSGKIFGVTPIAISLVTIPPIVQRIDLGFEVVYGVMVYIEGHVRSVPLVIILKRRRQSSVVSRT